MNEPPKIRLQRSGRNPILVPTNSPWESQATFNCAATVMNGRIVLVYRAVGDDGISRLGLAFSDDGYTVSERHDQPLFTPEPDSPYEVLGVEDPRVTMIDGVYYMTYTGASHYPPVSRVTGFAHQGEGVAAWRTRVSLAHTRDFKTFTRHGVILSHIDSKDAALFSKQFDGNFLVIHRAMPDMRLAIMPDPDHFSERGPILSPSANGWDSRRVGVGAPPIETPFGWLLIYHGVDEHNVYHLGLALLDLNNPAVVLGRTHEPILSPKEQQERHGRVNNVVFSCGAVLWHNELLVYYGSGDHVTDVASVPYADLMAWAEQTRRRSIHPQEAAPS